MSAYDPKDKIREAMRAYYESEIEATLYVTRGDSPIENILICALYAWAEMNTCCLRNVNPENLRGRTLERATAELLDEDRHYLPYQSQAQIENYRVDFVFYSPTVKLVVECDGHNFHERTKEQAEADRSRDRRLQELGYKVFRFTGREIYRDPMKCAEQIADAL